MFASRSIMGQRPRISGGSQLAGGLPTRGGFPVLGEVCDLVRHADDDLAPLRAHRLALRLDGIAAPAEDDLRGPGQETTPEVAHRFGAPPGGDAHAVPPLDDDVLPGKVDRFQAHVGPAELLGEEPEEVAVVRLRLDPTAEAVLRDGDERVAGVAP